MTQKEIDAAKHQEFVDWKFEEWLKSKKSALSSELDSGVRELLRAAFHAGAKQ